jgi:hypothetical protein
MLGNAISEHHQVCVKSFGFAKFLVFFLDILW